MRSFFISLLVIVSCLSQAQPPKIGSDKELKQTLAMIKEKMPDIKKNLTVEAAGVRKPNFKMGNAVLSFEESASAETLTIRFSAPVYYSGTQEEFRNYYNEVVAMMRDLYKNSYDISTNDEAGKRSTSFDQKYVTKDPRRQSMLVKLLDISDPWLTISFMCTK